MSEKLKFNLDLKQTGMAKKVVEIINSLNAKERVLVSSFSPKRLDEFLNVSQRERLTSGTFRENAIARFLPLQKRNFKVQALQAPFKWRGIQVYSKKLDQKTIENIMKKKFSLSWRWFYRMQIPLIIGYHKFFKDLTTFHIWGTVCMNQVLNVSSQLNSGNEKSSLDYFTTNNILIENLGTNAGISAMSISDMTKIPRATIIRKCKYLIKEDLIKLNEKKQYVLTSMNFRKILPYQTEIFKYKAKFIRKVLNLRVIS